LPVAPAEPPTPLDGPLPPTPELVPPVPPVAEGSPFSFGEIVPEQPMRVKAPNASAKL
jgi:hypothetical protein